MRDNQSASRIAKARVVAQKIGVRHSLGVGEIVAHLGAVQAQDYLGALWALGVRIPNGTERTVENAIAERAVVRTWPMRGTLHFVPAIDIRWMLELLTPRVIARNARRYQELELTAAVFGRARDVVERALGSAARLTRPAVYDCLARAGIDTTGARGLHILGFLAQQAVICFGPRDGKQQTLVLVDEWVPDARRLTREESLAELARRYFTSHGPATLHDFVWWSGLPVADARAAVELNGGQLRRELVLDTPHFRAPRSPWRSSAARGAHLLPAFDELIVAYRDRSAVVDPTYMRRLGAGGVMWPSIVLGSRAVGTWRRELTGKGARIRLEPFVSLTRQERAAIEGAARRYGSFLERSVDWHWA